MNISVSDYIAAGSLLVAIVALVISFLSDRKVKRFDLLLKEKELRQHEADEEDMKKADVEVEVIETAPKKANMLRFYNKGRATARNVTFTIPSDKEDDKIVLIINNDYLPYPQLISFQKFEVGYYNNSSIPHQTVIITWDDDFAKGRRKEMVIDM